MNECNTHWHMWWGLILSFHINHIYTNPALYFSSSNSVCCCKVHTINTTSYILSPCSRRPPISKFCSFFLVLFDSSVYKAISYIAKYYIFPHYISLILLNWYSCNFCQSFRIWKVWAHVYKRKLIIQAGEIYTCQYIYIYIDILTKDT